jgi:hypothetical protein
LPDLVDYLEAKEELVATRHLEAAAGEEELLALFLTNMEGDRHAFPFSRDGRSLVLEGVWRSFESHPERRAQLAANEISYSWDRLIEKFTHYVLAGTTEYQSHSSIEDFERGIRLMAAENRTKRRMLATQLLGILRRGNDMRRAVRVIKPGNPSSPYYIFMSLAPDGAPNRETYREVRRNMLAAYCEVLRLRCPDALDIIGIASEPERFGGNSSEDLLYFDAREWTEELRQDAEALQRDTGILTEVREWRLSADEYPLHQAAQVRKGRHRNDLCLCGSGRKFKKCCGRAA